MGPTTASAAETKHGKASSATVDNQSSSAALSRGCRRCLTHLTKALDENPRPQHLLRALGAAEHGSTDGSETKKLYAPAEDERGVIISLEKLVSEEDIAVRRDGDTDHQPRSAREHTRLDDTATLARRFTEAATVLVKNIQHTVENGSVLTTSPAHESETHDMPKQVAPKKELTTISIECVPCGEATRAEAGARAFVKGPDPLSIVLCSNRLASQGEIDEVLVHELVHIYDVHSRRMDLRQCDQLAYSEIRAAREAECSGSRTSFTANLCARDKATVATRNIFPEEGRTCVCDVFDEAMKDRAPFSEAESRRPARNPRFVATALPFPFSRHSDR